MSEVFPAAAIVKPRLPRGLVDRGPDEIAAVARMMDTIRAVFELYGFEPLETPLIEYTDALGKFLPDQDRPNEGVFSLRDDDEQWLSLRYDLTAPLARYVAENYDRLSKPYRSYRAGPVFRNEKPGPGRFRQFIQIDADSVGAPGVAADAEMCMMACDCLERLGIGRGDYVVKVNNRKVLDGLMEALGLGGAANAARRLVVLRAIDKLDRLGPDAVFQLLTDGRKDESGDFTRGAELAAERADNVMRFLGFAAAGRGYADDAALAQIGADNAARLAWLERNVELSPVGREGLHELAAISAIALAAGYDADRILVDRSVVRGLEYYTGPVFEADLTLQATGRADGVKTHDGKARPLRFGSVCGGGRYDGLVGRFRGDSVPATGFSVGLSRLISALEALDSPLVAKSARRGPVVVLVLDHDHIAAYQALVGRLRGAGIAAELYLGAAGMNAQLKYADRRRSVCAVIQGSNERQHADGPQVMIRDLVAGAELAAASKDRSDYLEMRQRAQFPVGEERLVEAVREVLTRHGAAPAMGL